MLSNAVLLVGIASVAAVVGYMAGGSATPVASVAIPAVFGLAVTALGLLQATQPSKDLLEFIRSLGKDADTQPDIVEYRQRVRTAPVRVGIALTVFSACYIVAATYGASVRINKALVQAPSAKPFPWQDADTPPPTISSALEWLALQSRLSELGYSDQQIASLYAIQTSEWKAAAAAAAAAAATLAGKAGDGDSAGAAAPGSRPTLPGAPVDWNEWLKQGGVRGDPFARQPSKELIERLRDLRVPGKGPPSAMPS